MTGPSFRKAFLILLVLAISATFVAMIRDFLMTILLAAIVAGLAYPLYARLTRLFRGRRAAASAVTLAAVVLLVIGPLATVLGIVAAQAFRISETVTPWVRDHLTQVTVLEGYLDRIPGIEHLEPYREQILTKAGELVGSTGSFLFRSISATTRGTVAFLFHFGLLLYTMFFFLTDGDKLLRKIMFYLPLPEEDERRMADKFVSVTRATVKGTLLIGLLQGTLAGAGFAAAGIQGALFWGTVMTLLSIIPGIGTALVWVPAVIVLLLTGEVAWGIALGLWCALVVGSVDNLLRPRLVGRDTQMHELLILFGTLGGILLFGVVGFIVGPIVAALFVTVWEMYGTAFREDLPAVSGEGDA
jgi:predicted PurR-regulated permease PerM